MADIDWIDWIDWMLLTDVPVWMSITGQVLMVLGAGSSQPPDSA